MIVMNIMAMMMTEMVVMIPIRTLLRSLAQESRMKIIQTRAQAYMKANPTETRLGVTNGRYSFRGGAYRGGGGLRRGDAAPYIYIYIYRGLVFLSDSLLNLELFTAAGVMKCTEQGKGISRGHMQWPLGRTLT